MTEAKNPLRNILKSEFPYKGHIIDVRVDTVKFPSGAEKLREVVLHSPAVAMLAEDADGGIFLVKQYRHAVDEEIYEIPAGLVEEGDIISINIPEKRLDLLVPEEVLAERRKKFQPHVQPTDSPFLSRYRAFATSGVEGGVLRDQ